MDQGLRWAALTSALCILAGVLIQAQPVYAVPAKPPTDWSFYVETTSTTTLYNLGCNQGHFDANNGKSNSAVVLDFGAQNSANTGTTEINGVGISYGTVESLAEQFARG